MDEDVREARAVLGDLEAKLGMPWHEATGEQLREAGCVSVRDYIAGLPEDRREEIERLKAEMLAGIEPDCSDIPEITDEAKLVMARDRRDAEGRLIPGMRSTST